MAEAALVLSIKFAQTPSDTFCLSSLSAAKASLFTPACAAESAHTVLSRFPLPRPYTYHRSYRSLNVLMYCRYFYTKRAELILRQCNINHVATVRGARGEIFLLVDFLQ